jgi:glycosyltransferase involved in cell wall biosynthesis
MNVCHLISGDLWAGAEVQTFTLLESLAGEGNINLSVIVLNEGTLADKLKRRNIDTIVIDETKNDFVQIHNKLKSLLIDKSPDILHTHRYKENILGARLKKRCRIKFLCQTVHGLTESFTGSRRLKMDFYSRLNQYYTKRYFDRIIAVSEDIKGQLAEYYNPDKIEVIHNSVDLEKIKPVGRRKEIREEFGIDDDTIVIGSAGRMVPVKGYEILLESARILLEDRNDVYFLLAGDGPQKNELEKLAENLKITDRFKFVGFRDDIYDFLDSLDIFVMTSHHEGIPIILLEAMALEKPIVATSVGGIPEIVDNGLSGLLVSPGNPNKLTVAYNEIISNHKLRKKIEMQSKITINERFTGKIQIQKILRLYTDKCQ